MIWGIAFSTPNLKIHSYCVYYFKLYCIGRKKNISKKFISLFVIYYKKVNSKKYYSFFPNIPPIPCLLENKATHLLQMSERVKLTTRWSLDFDLKLRLL